MEYQPTKSPQNTLPTSLARVIKTAATFSNLNRFHCHNSLSLPQKNSYNSSSEHRRRDAHTPAYLKTLPPPPSPYAIAERGYVSPAFSLPSSSTSPPPLPGRPGPGHPNGHERISTRGTRWTVVAACDWLKSGQTGRKMILAIFSPITRELESHSYYGFLFWLNWVT